jgi:hypothetical protein
MKKMLLTISACLLVAGLALGDAGYGRGPESDPVATPILSTATGNIATLQGQMITVTEDVATLQSSVWAAPGLTPATNGLENAVTIQTKSLDGENLAGYRVLHVWTSETDLGAASTNNIVSLVLSTGTAVATVEANADYWYCTAAGGSALATVTATAAGTNYIMCADGSTVSSAAIVFTE